jgi:hypothetical protein
MDTSQNGDFLYPSRGQKDYSICPFPFFPVECFEDSREMQAPQVLGDNVFDEG